MENWWKQSLEASLQPLVVDFSKSGCLSRVEAVDDCHSRYIKVVTVLLHVCVCVILPSPAYENERILCQHSKHFHGNFLEFSLHLSVMVKVSVWSNLSTCQDLISQVVLGAKGQIWWCNMCNESHINLSEKATSFLVFLCESLCDLFVSLPFSVQMAMILNRWIWPNQDIYIYTNISNTYIYICIYICTIYFPLSKLLILGMVIPAPIGNPGTGYSNPY